MQTSIPEPCVILDQNSPKINQPDKINIRLKEHQKSLVYKCRELENSTNKQISVDGKKIVTKFGIIGDIVGSGKTLSVLSLIATCPVVNTHITRNVSNSLVSVTYDTPEPPVVKHNVIIVPHNILKQWSDTIDKHTQLKYICINNTKSLEKYKEETVKPEFDDYDIILVSSTRYNQFMVIKENYDKVFSRVIFDEADSIKIPACHVIRSSFLWFVTSTYNTLCCPYGQRYYINEETGQYRNWNDFHNGFTKVHYIDGIKNTGFIKNTMSSLNQSQLLKTIKPHIIIKNSDEYIKQAFDLPDYITHILKSKNPISLSVLNSFASKEIMDRINGGDIQGAIEKLNCHKVSEKDLIKGVTNDFEEKLHNKKIELKMKSQMTYSSENAKIESLTKIKEKINDLETKINGIKDKINDNNLCCICYDDIENMSVTMCCNTKFCIECISKWLHTNKMCPFCRASITNDNICVVTDNIPTGGGGKKELPTKIEHLMNIIEQNKDNSSFKLLVFADFDNSFNDTIKYLQSIGIKYSRVMGTTASIEKTLRRYKNTNINDPERVDVLMLNADYCASGINLENTSDIVIYHTMTEQKTKQIIGRGQRPGRVGPLNVWGLCYSTEIV